MDITVSLQIKITFDGNKKVSVGNVATAVKGLGLEQKVTEAVIERVDEELVEKYNYSFTKSPCMACLAMLTK